MENSGGKYPVLFTSAVQKLRRVIVYTCKTPSFAMRACWL
jgi:hypothetical protein